MNLKIRLGRNSFKEIIEAGNFIKDMFSKNLRSDGFCEWFANELGFDNEIKYVIIQSFQKKRQFSVEDLIHLVKLFVKML